MTRQVVSKGANTRCRAEEEIPSQTKARDLKAVCGEDVCRHRRISWSCNKGRKSFG
jgi:hypothetical protein